MIQCAGARWHSLHNLPVPPQSHQGEKQEIIHGLVRLIQERSRQRLHPSNATANPKQQRPAAEEILDLEVSLAFHHLHLAEQRLLLGDDSGLHLHCRMFLGGLLAAAIEVLGQGFAREEQEPILAVAKQLPGRLTTQLELRQAVHSGELAEHLIFVLGMHRSGTSALSGMLCKAGFDGPSDLMPPQVNNPLGYWESQGLCGLNDAFFKDHDADWSEPHKLSVGWEDTPMTARWRHEVLTHFKSTFSGAQLPVIKDPRLCILLDGLTPWLESEWIQPSIILTIRDPFEVAGSLEKAEKIPVQVGIQLWLHHVLAAEYVSRGYPRLVIHHDELLRHPEQCLERCQALIGRTIQETDAQEGISFVTTELYHQRRVDVDTKIRQRTHRLASARELAIAIFCLLRDDDLHAPSTVAQLDSLAAQWRLLPELDS